MSIISTQGPSATPPFAPAETLPDYDRFITEDETPVDNFYCERQHRLLTDALFASWAAPQGRPHLAATDVALFYSANEPSIVPDVMVSLGVVPPTDWKRKEDRCYYTWLMGKSPDLSIEVVSNVKGGELTNKLETYSRIGIPYYVVWDPGCFLSDTPLQCFVLKGKTYEPCQPWFPDLEMGVTTWDGDYDGISGRWLRFSDRNGQVLATGVERAKVAQDRADAAEKRAALLSDKLRELGVDPDQV